MLLPEGGAIRHIFELELAIIQKISERYELQVRPDQRSSFFGTVSQNGCIHVWEVGVVTRTMQNTL